MKMALKCLLIGIAIIIIFIFGINFYVKQSTKNRIIKNQEYKDLSDVDCIIILGAGVWGDKPSPMLEDRLLEGINLYKNNVSSKIIMSGDHGREDYDEVNLMKNYAIDVRQFAEKVGNFNPVFAVRIGTYDIFRLIKRNNDALLGRMNGLVIKRYRIFRFNAAA